MASTKIWIGVDGGGTKTIGCCIDSENKMIGIAITGSTNQNSVGLESAKQELQQAILKAIQNANRSFEDVVGICLGISGVDREQDIQTVKNWIFELFNSTNLKIKIVNDGVVALAAGTDGILFGVVVISGTGTISLGFNHQQQTCRASGWGGLLGDEGSGYAIAAQALKAIVNQEDGIGPKTSMTEKMFEAIGITNAQDLIPWAYKDTAWNRFAALFPVVETCAKEGDIIANQILDDAANGLFNSICAVVTRLQLQNEPSFPIVLAGGILTHDDSPVAKRLILKLQNKYQNSQIKLQNLEAHNAAALLAFNSFSI
eukprot:TRINITY_DN596_c0_g1_i1.p2 TRINITY_DN596_c0_g1~~TRINITY_DN596_c0_g1_i1.p2  ORF type:complete len:315 (-),score=144.67 TRINITY_DN596_c0_g1_i1:63-1007(-)